MQRTHRVLVVVLKKRLVGEIKTHHDRDLPVIDMVPRLTECMPDLREMCLPSRLQFEIHLHHLDWHILCPGPTHNSPISSFQSRGFSVMNSCIIVMHSVRLRSITSTP